MEQPHRSLIALVAEDEPIFRMEVVGILEDEGYAVLEVDRAGDALARMEGGAAIALLVTDILMPGPMDGLGLAREVAQRWPATAVIVVSAVRVPEAGELPEGIAFLERPFTTRSLLSLVRGAPDRSPAVPGP
jgi:CheY-like chemotaxis protein